MPAKPKRGSNSGGAKSSTSSASPSPSPSSSSSSPSNSLGRNKKSKSKNKSKEKRPDPAVLVPFGDEDDDGGGGGKEKQGKRTKRFQSKKQGIPTSKGNQGKRASYGKDGVDRAIVEDHVKDALRKGGMGPGITPPAPTDEFGKYIAIALLVVTMGALVVVLVVDIDGLDALYEFLESNQQATYVIFALALGLPTIIIACIILSMCRKRDRGSSVSPYDKPCKVASFDPSMEESPSNTKMIEIDAELKRKESVRRFDDELSLEDEDDQSAVAENYL